GPDDSAPYSHEKNTDDKKDDLHATSPSELCRKVDARSPGREQLLRSRHDIVTDLLISASIVAHMSYKIWLAALFVFVTILPTPLSGAVPQTGVANGSIRGSVHDATGAVVPGVAVRARNLATGFERLAYTNEIGEFDLPLLPLGNYEVEAMAAGFANFAQAP